MPIIPIVRYILQRIWYVQNIDSVNGTEMIISFSDVIYIPGERSPCECN